MKPTTKIPQDVREEVKKTLVEIILRTWDFCGNPREAARDVFGDTGLPFDEDLYDEARWEAGEIWETQKRAARAVC